MSESADMDRKEQDVAHHEMRERLKNELSRQRKTMKDASLAIGQHQGYISEFCSGKHGMMNGEALQKLADFLGRSVPWIMFGVERDDEARRRGSASQAIPELAVVEPTVEKEVVIVGLNLSTGECALLDPISGEDLRGRITDPDLWVPENRYAMSFLSRRPLTVVTKRGVDAAGRATWFIIDSKKR